MPFRRFTLLTLFTTIACVPVALWFAAGSGSRAGSLGIALAAAVAGCALGHLLSVRSSLDKGTALLEGFFAEVRKMQENQRNLVTLAATDATAFLGRRGQIDAYSHDLMRQAGHASIASVCGSLPKFRAHSIDFEGEYLVWESYAIVWRELIRRQQKGNGSPLEISAVHMLPIDVWLSPRGDEFLELQQTFIGAGGTVTRYMVGPAFTWTDEDVTARVLSRMIRIGITVYYIPFDILTADNLQMADFMWRTDGDWVFQWDGLFHTSRARLILRQDELFDHFATSWRKLTRLVEERGLFPVTEESRIAAAFAAPAAPQEAGAVDS